MLHTMLGHDANLILMIYLTLFMVVAMVSDAYCFKIPNWLNGALLLSYPVAYVLFQTQMDWLMGLAGFAAVFALGYVIFVFKIMGGGDVKLFAVCGLWIGWSSALVDFILFAMLLGGPLTLLLLAARPVAAYYYARYGREGTDIPRVLSYGEPVPYGIAIGAAFIIMLWAEKLPIYYGYE